MNITGNVAIVTGGSSGLGEASARMLAEKGAKVIILDVNEIQGGKIAEDIKGLFIKTDITDAAEVKTALAQIKVAFGIPRILVNCAGILIASRTVGKSGPYELEAFSKVIQVNLIGTFNCIRLFANEAQTLESLEDNERGVIINTASVAAFDGQIGQAAYSASKGGVASMTLPVARDLSGLGIRNVTIAPGIFNTPMMSSLPQDIQDALGASVPFPKRMGQPKEFASLVCHICENKMINGETIRIDGAIRMAPK